MARVLTDGKIKIGAYMFPDRKKPCLCIQKGSVINVFGSFHNIEQADEFMNELAKMVGAEMEGGKNT